MFATLDNRMIWCDIKMFIHSLINKLCHFYQVNGRYYFSNSKLIKSYRTWLLYGDRVRVNWLGEWLVS